MALTIVNLYGAETGGLEDVYSTSGNASVVGAAAHKGAYGYRVPGTSSVDRVTFRPEDAGLSWSTTGRMVGFWIRFSDNTPAALGVFMVAGDISSVYDFGLALTTGGDLRVLDANGAQIGSDVTNPFSLNVWSFVEVYWEPVASGAIDVVIDGVKVLSATGQDLLQAASANAFISFVSVNPAFPVFDFDDVYCGNASSISDRLGGCDVFSYRSNISTTTPDSGSVLNSGPWANAQQVPFNDTNTASYTGTPLSGEVYTNDVGGSAGTGGPNTDANITGKIVAHKGVWRASRSGGGGTTHSLRLGNSVDGVESFTQALTTSSANYQKASNNATYVPVASEYGSIGFGVSGNQDIVVYDMLYQVLHVPSKFLPWNPQRDMLPYLVR